MLFEHVEVCSNQLEIGTCYFSVAKGGKTMLFIAVCKINGEWEWTMIIALIWHKF